MESMNGSANIAAWVQALGAMLALFVAIWAPMWFAARARRRRLETVFVVCEYVAELVEEVNEAFQKGEAHYNGYVEFSYNPGVWKQALADLNSVPIYEIEGPKVVGHLLGLRAMFGNAVGFYETVPSANDPNMDYVEYAEAWKRYADGARAAVTGIRAAM